MAKMRLNKQQIGRIWILGKRIIETAGRLGDLSGGRWGYQYVLEELAEQIESMSTSNLGAIAKANGVDANGRNYLHLSWLKRELAGNEGVRHERETEMHQV